MTLLLLLSLLGIKMQATNLELSLEQTINYALVQNFDQRSLVVDKQIQQTLLEESKLALTPSLSANLSHGYGGTIDAANWSGSYDLSASMTLFEGGKNINAIKLSKLSLSQSDAKVTQAQNNLTMQVIESFLSILMHQEMYKYLVEVAHTSQQQMKQGEHKWEHGKIIESDFLLLKAQATTDQYNVIETEIKRDNAILALKSLLSLSESDTLSITPPETQMATLSNTLPALTDVIERTIEWLPDLVIERQNIEISRLNIRQAQTAYMPKLSLTGSIGSGYLGGGSSFGNQLYGRFNGQVGLALSIPIWDKGRTRSQVKQSTYQLQQSQLSAANTSLKIRQQLEQEYNNVCSGYQKYRASSTRADAYKESAKAYRAQYELGAITVVEMLQQEMNFLSALSEYVQNKYSYLLNRKLIDVYMGIKIDL